MHVPDGFLDVPTSIGTAVVATAGIAGALRGARRDLDERTTPIAGLVAVFIFAGQMINFPVGAGTSGHLLGGALAAVLAGPWLATLALSVVLIVQAFLFADGGITALGSNVVLMGLVGVWVGWFAFRAAVRFSPAPRPRFLRRSAWRLRQRAGRPRRCSSASSPSAGRPTSRSAPSSPRC